MLEMAIRDYIPAVTAYIGDLARNVSSVEDVSGISMDSEREHLSRLSSLLSKTYAAHRELERVENIAIGISGTEEAAFYYCTEVATAMKNLRAAVDALEVITARDYWPVPTYGDMTYREIL